MGPKVVMHGQAELLEIVAAQALSGRFPGGLDGRQQQSDEQADDGDGHEEFDKREPLSTGSNVNLRHDSTSNDKEKRKMTRETNENMPNSQTRLCNTCNKELDLTYFVGIKSESTKTCSNCREQNRIQDAKRDKDHRNELARLAEAKPERKAVKQEWVENNYDKVALKWMNYRHRKIETLGVEEFLKKNNKYLKKFLIMTPFLI